jgi:hypothetical protein
MHVEFSYENLKGISHFGDLGIDGKIIMKWNLEEYGVSLWTRCMWLIVGTGRGLL